jgi:hypothetical protein
MFSVLVTVLKCSLYARMIGLLVLKGIGLVILCIRCCAK